MTFNEFKTVNINDIICDNNYRRCIVVGIDDTLVEYQYLDECELGKVYTNHYNRFVKLTRMDINNNVCNLTIDD
jgi:hypothetical protein